MNREDISDFIALEAELIDDKKFTEWLDLFTQDSHYWVPAEHGQTSPLTHVSLFYDDHSTLKTRVARLVHPQMHCQTPLSRTVHVMGRPRITATEADTAHTRTGFVMIEDRQGTPKRVFAGYCEHRLIRSDDRLRIAEKKVVLTDCDQTFPALTIPF